VYKRQVLPIAAAIGEWLPVDSGVTFDSKD